MTSSLPALAEKGQIGSHDTRSLSFRSREAFGESLCGQKSPDGGTTDAQRVGNRIVTETLLA
jgi:hypothetical protein